MVEAGPRQDLQNVTASIEIQPLTAPLNASIRPPGSKSLTNRALICAALARGRSSLRGVLESDDTRVMIDALGALGLAIDEDRTAGTLEITGCCGAIPARSAELFIGNSGTSVRFLTALVALGNGRFRLHGSQRMHERPIQDLLDALARLGVNAVSEAGTGCPPVVVEAHGIRLAKTEVRSDVSSQFLSALLLIAPCADGAADGAMAHIEVAGPLVSKPYVAMTLAVMKSFGVSVEHDPELTRFDVPKTGYRACSYEIEPDASAASYFWAAAAIAGGQVQVEGLGTDSLQGDVAFCDCLASMGCEVTYGARWHHGPRKAAGGNRRRHERHQRYGADAGRRGAVRQWSHAIRGVAHIRHKETDRIGALATELRKLGARVDEHADGLTIVPGALRGTSIDTYDDHRMAMSLSLAGLKIPGVVINDPACTAKTYPRFFEDLRRLGGK